MKTLIEESIQIISIPSDRKNIFNIIDESEKNDTNYLSLTNLQRRVANFEFLYSEEDVEYSSIIKIVIPELETEEGIKQFIIDQINNSLI
jgi:hypothetical protein